MLSLVTGATGLVGNNVLRRLLDRGDAVRVLIRERSSRRPIADLPVETVVGDVADPVALDAAMRGVDLVVHAAAQVQIGWSGLERARKINVEGTRNVAEAALRGGAKMVHVSSVDALGIRLDGGFADEDTPTANGVPCPYVVTKREAEQALLRVVDNGLDASIVNPAFMLGPWDWRPSSGRMLLQVAKGRAVAAPRGSNSFCDVRDVASGILAAAERGATGRRYILAGVTMSYFDAWRLFADITGARRPIMRVGPVALAVAGRIGDFWGKVSGNEPDVNSAATAMAMQPRNFSSARAQKELGYAIRPLADTVRDAWRWFQEYGYA